MEWDAIRKEYETGTITLKALAEKYGVKEGTLKSRKSREKWKSATKKNATSNKKKVATKKDATKTKKVATSKPKRNPMIGNKNALGNRGNPSPVKKFTERNTASLKHGFFSKYIPQDTLDIIGELETKSTADMIWDQIIIQYAAIIRAQKIMFVNDKDDLAKEQIQYGFGETGSDKYEVQFAWDRHASFMNAQSRAMSELRSLIKQFDEIAHIEDERRLKLEQMSAGIQKTKAEVEKLTNDEDGDGAFEIIVKRKGVDE